MADYRKYEMRDPAEVLERKEGMSCKGCKFRVAWTIGRDTVEVCQKKKTMMRKCAYFKESE